MIDVYCCTAPNGKRYVGIASRGLRDRWCKHRSDALRRSTTALHRAIQKYGPGSFQLEVLERMTTWQGAAQAEKLWISELESFGPNGYNLTSGGDGTLGRKHNEATRAKMAAARVGRKLSATHIANVIAAKRGTRMTVDNKARLIAANTGRKPSVETLAKMSASRRGKKATEETRAKMRESAKRAWARRGKS